MLIDKPVTLTPRNLRRLLDIVYQIKEFAISPKKGYIISNIPATPLGSWANAHFGQVFFLWKNI